MLNVDIMLDSNVLLSKLDINVLIPKLNVGGVLEEKVLLSMLTVG